MRLFLWYPVFGPTDESCYTVWRILVGLSLIPAFGTLYQRLTLPESTRYTESRKGNTPIADEESIEELKKKANADPAVSEKPVPTSSSDGTRTPPSETESETAAAAEDARAKRAVADLAAAKKAHFRDFFQYFSEWRHLKILMGTCTCWFLLDIAYVPPLSRRDTPVLTRPLLPGSTAST